MSARVPVLPGMRCGCGNEAVAAVCQDDGKRVEINAVECDDCAAPDMCGSCDVACEDRKAGGGSGIYSREHVVCCLCWVRGSQWLTRKPIERDDLCEDCARRYDAEPAERRHSE